jgi:hypothetical protein
MPMPFVSRAFVLATLTLTFAGRLAQAQAPEAGGDDMPLVTPNTPDMTKKAGALLVPPDPDKLLTTADALVDSGEFKLAAVFYQRILTEYPDSPAAFQASRSLKIIKTARLDMTPVAEAIAPVAPPAPALPPPRPSAALRRDADTVLRLDPYSVRTAERLRLSTWEKLDFGITSFLYGLSLGATYSLTLDEDDTTATPIAIGALAYTLGAVGYLSSAHPDRGDLPLALAITSYVPTSTLLLSNLLFPSADSRDTGIAVTVAGLAAIPIAVFATRRLNLDPGDTQLVRDAGFWGLVLGTVGCLGFGTETHTVTYTSDPYTYTYPNSYMYTREPTSRTIAAWGAGGLFGGLALGVLAAAKTELSLERIRVTTWGGYGGGLLGALLVAGAHGEEAAVFKGIAVGAGIGLLATFLSTGSLDGIPPETAVVSRLLPRGMIPTVLAAPGLATGSAPAPLLGLAGVLN